MKATNGHSKNSLKLRDNRTSASKKQSVLSNELEDLEDANVQALRARYLAIFKSPTPAAFGPDLLRKSIAHEIQKRAWGGTPNSAEKSLKKLIKDFRSRPHERIEFGRKIKIGSELARTWKGNMHRVVVRADGFVYAGRTFASLSEIARLIAGSRWNGPKFFGLRRRRLANDD